MPPVSVRMLTSLLNLYPEIGSARLADGGNSLVLEFYLRHRMTTLQLRGFLRELRQAYSMFDMVFRTPKRVLKVYRGEKRSSAEAGLPPLNTPGFDLGALLDAEVAGADASLAEGLGFWPCDVDSRVLAVQEPKNFDEYWDGLMQALECLVLERDIASLTREELEILIQSVRYAFDTEVVVEAAPLPDEEQLQAEGDNLEHCLADLRSYSSFNASRGWDSRREIAAYHDGPRLVVLNLFREKSPGGR